MSRKISCALVLPALISPALWTGSAPSSFAPSQGKGDPKPRRVEGQILTSTEMPAVRLQFDKRFNYVGTQTFILYNVARAGPHFFVDADDKGGIKRLYWVQFEGYFPDNANTYKYETTKTVDVDGLDFIADAYARNYKVTVARPDSDGATAIAFLEGKGYHWASEDRLSQRIWLTRPSETN